jgi:nitroreductase
MPDSAAAELRLRAEELAEVLRGRRSINLFEPESVEVDVLMDAIEVARWAPNHRLTEPWRFYVIGEKTKQAIARTAADFEAETKGERVGAARLQRLSAIPAYFVVTARRSDDPLLDREDYAATCCAIQNLMLYMWQRGVGVKWTTGAITREQRFYDLLGIDRHAETVVGFFWYGRAKVVPEQSRKDVSDIVVALD